MKSAALSAPLIGLFPADLSALGREFRESKIEKRMLGRTGVKISAIGFGGIVVKDASEEEANRRVKQAIDYGINYFDIAPSYGNAELKLGPALQPYRKDVFLACKTTERKREGARRELEQSLINLRTDHFDLYQFHAVTTMDEVETIFGKDGAMECFLEARKEGKIKHIGFSAHSVEAALNMMDRFEFDTILFPFNFATWYAGNFGPQVMAKAKEKGMGILALKAMAKKPWPEDAVQSIKNTWYEPIMNMEEANLALRFTLSHPVTAAIPPGDENLFEMAIKLAVDFKPLNRDEIEMIKQKGLETEPIFRYEG